MVEPREFGSTWMEMVERLTRVLAARGVPAQDREDLVQETALRLYRVWDTIDPEQPVWPYAVTIALNLWRDSLRASGPYLRSVDASVACEPVAGLDVERTVIARQELAEVSAALRTLAPEQRRLVLETEELSAVVRPLRASERMSRMRVRRELARVVGRASAIAALIWLRRPHRAQAFAAVAFTGALAATVFSGSPAVSITGVVPMSPAIAAPVAVVVHHVAAPVAAVRSADVVVAHRAVVHRAAAVHRAASPALICAPASSSGPASQSSASQSSRSHTNGLSGTVASTVAQALGSSPAAPTAPSAPQPVVSVPTAHASDDGCVSVS